MKRLILLIVFTLAGCGDKNPKAWMPPHVVVVVDVSHDVELSHWCEPEKTCMLASRQDVDWQVESDGQLKVVNLGEELRFERGLFNRPDNGDPSWVADEMGDYLLATTDARRALIIHYPLTLEEKAAIKAKYEGQFGGF